MCGPPSRTSSGNGRAVAGGDDALIAVPLPQRRDQLGADLPAAPVTSMFFFIVQAALQL